MYKRNNCAEKRGELVLNLKDKPQGGRGTFRRRKSPVSQSGDRKEFF